MAIYQLLLVASIVCTCMGRHHHHGPLPEAVEFFGVPDSINITWAHAVNSKHRLRNALEGNEMMLEADILIGKLHANSSDVPIMAHPPSTSSDISFETFLLTVIDAIENGRAKKGIKLDFKQLEAVEPALRILKANQNSITFPVWLNADVLQGPVNSSKNPVDGESFLNLTQRYFPRAKLSLGWTTMYGKDALNLDHSNAKEITNGSYTQKQIEQMMDLLQNYVLISPKPTFAVRAGLALNSKDTLLTLQTLGSTTIWSAEGDLVDIEKLQELISALGRNNVYIDVPFNIDVEPTSPSFDDNIPDIHKRNDTDHSDDVIHPDAPGVSSILRNNLHILLLFVSVFFIKQYFY